MSLLSELKKRVNVIDEQRGQTCIDDAIALVAMESKLSVDRVDNWPRMAQLIVLGVARRIYQNPLGLEYETVGNYSARRSDSTASGQLELTKAELQQLRKLTGQGGLGSLKVTRG